MRFNLETSYKMINGIVSSCVRLMVFFGRDYQVTEIYFLGITVTIVTFAKEILKNDCLCISLFDVSLKDVCCIC